MNDSQKSSYGKTSLICGIISLFIFPVIFGLIVIVLGITGMSKPKENDATTDTSAIIGIVLAVCSILYAFSISGLL